MGKIDDTMYDYLEQPDKFADFTNVALHNGKQVITVSMLEPDASRYVKKVPKENGGLNTGNRYRDLKKRLVNGAEIGVIAIENQDKVDYIMPLRIMEYDCLEYHKQVKRIRQRKYAELKDAGKIPNDWNTRLTEDDKINPVQTICLYHGEEEWTGPESLRDMINWKNAPQDWEEDFHDYGMTLFCVNRIEDFSVFRTELGQLLQAVSCKNNKEKLKALFQRGEYSHLERETAEAIAVITDNNTLLDKLDEYEEDGGYNMCKGLDDWAKEEQEKGAARGRREGKLEGKLESIKNIMESMKITAEEAMKLLKVPMDERAEYRARL